MSILIKDKKESWTLRHLCAQHADRFTNSRSAQPHRLYLLARIFMELAKKEPIELRLGCGSESELIYRYLHRHTWGFQTYLHQAVSVLEIPTERGLYELGRDHQTLRRMCRKAVKRGIHCRSVLDHKERQRLVRLAVEYERHHADVRYRRKHQIVSDLEGAGVWLVAHADEQRPIVLSVTPVAGNTAALRIFRTLESSQEATLARYLLTAYLIDELAERGTRYLVDITHPIFIPSGLHHFAAMLGFEVGRARLNRS